MKKKYFLSLLAFVWVNAWAANYGLPIFNDTSLYYYVPESKLEKQEKGLLASVSYSASRGNLESWSLFYGCRQCDLQNIILVNKKTKEKKPLFDSEKKISSFFVTNQSDLKKKFPPLLFLTLKTGAKAENVEFYIANLDGTKLNRVSPEGQTVVSYDFDTSNKKLILLLRKVSTKEDILNPAHPFIVDLQRASAAVPLFEN